MEELQDDILDQSIKNNILYAVISNFTFSNEELLQTSLEAFMKLIPHIKLNINIQVNNPISQYFVNLKLLLLRAKELLL